MGIALHGDDLLAQSIEVCRGVGELGVDFEVDARGNIGSCGPKACGGGDAC